MGVGELIEHIRALYVADLQRAFESSGEVESGFDAVAYDEGYPEYAKDKMW